MKETEYEERSCIRAGPTQKSLMRIFSHNCAVATVQIFLVQMKTLQLINNVIVDLQY